jgi:hypothetical protein
VMVLKENGTITVFSQIEPSTNRSARHTRALTVFSAPQRPILSQEFPALSVPLPFGRKFTT